MTVFADSCIAKDYRGEPQIFRAGRCVRLHDPSCPQIDGKVDAVRSCFYQNQTLSGPDALAVLLVNHSWIYCSNLEAIK